MGARARRFALALWALGAVLSPALGGCSAPEARAPNAMRSLDERRAVEIIRRAVTKEGAEPGPARSVMMSSGKPLTIDVSIQGRAYGIAYVTADDAAKLGDAIPPRNGKDERLRLVRAGESGDIRIVLLYQDNYLYDDLAGESHEQTTIASEVELARDVRDFITHARTKKYP